MSHSKSPAKGEQLRKRNLSLYGNNNTRQYYNTRKHSFFVTVRENAETRVLKGSSDERKVDVTFFVAFLLLLLLFFCILYTYYIYVQ